MSAHERINEMGRRAGNPEPRQFGSFSSSLKAAIVSTRHGCVWGAQAARLRLPATVPETSLHQQSQRSAGARVSASCRDQQASGLCSPESRRCSEMRNRQKKISSRVRNQADKISACDNITICSGSCLRTVMNAPIAQAQEPYRCLVRRRDSICATTGRGSRC
jgi:hypothetical protein